MRLNGQSYLNIILTVIAVLLLALAMKSDPQVSIATPAGAQEDPGSEKRFTLSQHQIAQGNMEIADKIGEVAKSLDNVAEAIEKAGAAKSLDNIAKALGGSGTLPSGYSTPVPAVPSRFSTPSPSEKQPVQ